MHGTIRSLPFPGRLGVICLCLVLLGGLVASAFYLYQHHEKKDEQPGLTLIDLQGAYHGVDNPSLLLKALNAGHPETLKAEQRSALKAWLEGTRIVEDYDNLDLGDNAPSEIIAANCVSCHARNASDPVAKKIPLDYFDDVKKIAFSRRINPVPASILLVSTHAHALALGCVFFVVSVLMLATSWPRAMRQWLPSLALLGLFIDLGAWWLSRYAIEFVYVIIVAGGAFNVLGVLCLVCVIIDALRPGKASPQA